jgi:hypothetical protein
MSRLFIASVTGRIVGLALLVAGFAMLVWNKRFAKATLASQNAFWESFGTGGRLRRWTVPEKGSKAERYWLVYGRVIILICAVAFIAGGGAALILGTED